MPCRAWPRSIAQHAWRRAAACLLPPAHSKARGRARPTLRTAPLAPPPPPRAAADSCLLSITRKAGAAGPLALNEVVLYGADGATLTSDQLQASMTSTRGGFAVGRCCDGDVMHAGDAAGGMTNDESTVPPDTSPGLAVRFPCSQGSAACALSRVVVVNT